MALNRFYQQGQSQYMSQYVPHKLPFELWQQGLANKDQQVDLDRQNALSLQTSDIVGIDQAKLGEYSAEYFINNPNLKKLITSPEGLLINDRQRSTNSANILNQKVDQILSDDFIFKSATGDIADSLIEAQQLRIKHDQDNAVYKQRETALGDIYKEVSSKKSEWELDPTLIMEQEREIQQMKNDPTYIPKNVGIGKYFDSSAYILNELAAKKDSGGKSFDTSDPAYLKWSSSHGVSAGEYASFATDIFNNTNSQVRRDAERKVDELIRSNHIRPEDRAEALDSELNQLIETGINLQHRTSDKGMSEKSQGQRDYEKEQQIFVVDAADQKVINGKTTDFKTIEGTYNRVGQSMTEATQFFQDKYGIDPKTLLNVDPNMLDQYFQNIGDQLGIPAYTLKDSFNQYKALNYQYETLSDNYENTKTILESTTGYTSAERSTESLFNVIKQNSTLAKQYLAVSQDPTNPQYRGVVNTPEYKEFLTIQKNNPELYNSLVNSIENENGLALYTSRDFIGNNGFDAAKAEQFLNANEIYYDKRQSGGVLTPATFDKLIRQNTSNYDLVVANQSINTKKDMYNLGANTSVNITDKRIETTPGINLNIDKAYRQELEQFSNPYLSTLTGANGEVIDNAAVKNALINTIFKANENVNVTMINGDTYKLDGVATNNLLTDTGNYQVFLDEYAMQKYGTPITKLDPEQLKEMNAEVKSFMSQESGFNLTLKVDGSSQFNDIQSDKISQHNANLNWNDPNQIEQNKQYVYAENVINNKSAIDQADQLSSNAAIINTGQSISPNLTRSEQVPFTITAYIDNQPIPLSYTLVGTHQSVDQSTANVTETSFTNTNGTPYTYSNNTGVGYNTEGNLVEGKKVYIYTFRDGNGNVEQIPATSASEAIQRISDKLNSPSQ